LTLVSYSLLQTVFR